MQINLLAEIVIANTGMLLRHDPSVLDSDCLPGGQSTQPAYALTAWACTLQGHGLD